MQKLVNPYTRIKGYNCFACAPGNDHGLKMEFQESGDFVVCDWVPDDHFQGYFNILHGGVQSTLMDEIAAWVIQVKLRTAGVTYKIETQFLRPVFMNEGPIRIKANIKEQKHRFVIVEAEILNAQDKRCSQGLITYYLYAEKEASEKLSYPGYEAFYNSEKQP